MRYKWLLLALCVLFLSGCKTPEVNLKSALLKNLTSSRLDVGLNLDVFNPNEYELPIQQVDWSLDLFNSRFNDGSVALKRNIPAARRVGVEVPLGIAFNAVAVGVQNILTKRSIPWGIDGGVAFRTPAGPVRADFGSMGQWANPLLR